MKTSKKAFDKKKIFIVNRRNKKLHQIIGGNHIWKSKIEHKNTVNQENVHHASHH